MKVFRLLIILAVVLSQFVSPSQVVAQDFEDVGLTISPAIIDTGGAPGTSVTREITLQNISGDAVGVIIRPESLLTNQILIDPSKADETDARNWITPGTTEVTLDRGETQVIPITINIPETANPGGHYASVSFESFSIGQQTSSGDTTTRVRPKLTASFLVTVPGAIEEQADIRFIERKVAYFGQTGTATIEVRNLGNIHILPSIETTVAGISEQDQIIRNSPELLLPNTLRRYEVEWKSEGLYQEGTIQTQVAFGTPQEIVLGEVHTIWHTPSLLSAFFIISIIGFTVFFIFFANNRRLAAQRLITSRRKLSTDPNKKQLSQTKAERGSVDTIAQTERLPDVKPRTISPVKRHYEDKTILSSDNLNDQKEYQASLTKNLKKKQKKPKTKK